MVAQLDRRPRQRHRLYGPGIQKDAAQRVSALVLVRQHPTVLRNSRRHANQHAFHSRIIIDRIDPGGDDDHALVLGRLRIETDAIACGSVGVPAQRLKGQEKSHPPVIGRQMQPHSAATVMGAFG